MCWGILGLVVVPETARAAVAETPDATWGVAGVGVGSSRTDARVYAMAVTNERIYIGGEFTQAVSSGRADATVVARSNLIALNAATGELDPGFNPEPSGPVRALAVANGRLYVGGRFVRVGGADHGRLAALDLATGAAIPGFRADADGPVWTIEVGQDRLYAGGMFDSVTDASGTPSAHRHIVALDPDTGDVDEGFRAYTDGGDSDGDPLTDNSLPGFVRSLKLSYDRTRLYVGGEFLFINGSPMESLAAVDPTTGVLNTAFDPRDPPRAFSIAVDQSRVYVAFGGGGGRAQAFDPTTGREVWRVTGNGDFQAVAVIGDVVYIGGHFGADSGSIIGFDGAVREKIAAVDAATGDLDPWDPVFNSALGVWSLTATGSALHVGGDFTRVNGEPQPHYARLSQLPEPPTGVTAVPGDSAATVSWVAAPGDGGYPITGYVVTPYADGVAQPPRAFLSVLTTQTVTGLTNGVAYTFRVAATSTMGTGLASAPSGAVVPSRVPSAPVSVSALPGDTVALVNWTAPVDNGGSTLTGYVVTPFRSGTAEAPRVSATAATSMLVTGLANGSNYRFSVAATNAVGNGPASDLSAEVTPRTVPAAPVAVTATAGNTQATVNWIAPPDDGGSPVTGYVVTPHRDGSPQPAVVLTGTATTYTAAALVNGASYTFTVAATNAAGSGTASDPSGPVIPHLPAGYWMLGSDGRVYTFGEVPDLGGPVGALSGAATVDLEPAPSLDGYWVVDAGGQVFAYGVRYLGGMAAGALRAGERVTSLAGTRTGAGYWIFTSSGRVFAFGDAVHLGDMAGVRLNGPVLDSVVTPSGLGYYMVAADGGIFTFGDAAYAGSMGGRHLNAPVQSMVPDGDGFGYWLVASDGGIFAFDAAFRGSMGGTPLNRPITGMVRYGTGYLMVGEDGGIFNFSDRAFSGSLGNNPPSRPIVAVASAT